jgi:hypothetical protein
LYETRVYPDNHVNGVKLTLQDLLPWLHHVYGG